MRTPLITVAATAIIICVTPHVAVAQEADPAAVLSVLVGDWTYEHIEGTVACRMIGETIVHCLTETVNADGETGNTVFLTWYDARTAMYRAARYYASGYTDTGTVWMDGPTWHSVFDSPDGDKSRLVQTFSEGRMSYQWSRSCSGGDWEDTSTGSATRSN